MDTRAGEELLLSVEVRSCEEEKKKFAVES
jgi:hypothetical protein